ncbi:MAG TPA: hypothetical protein VF459_19830 [Caulobacteraceae bacterium]
MAGRWRGAAVASRFADLSGEPQPIGDGREALLDPAVLERYLLLLSLEVEAQRVVDEYKRELAEIDARQAAGSRPDKTGA